MPASCLRLPPFARSVDPEGPVGTDGLLFLSGPGVIGSGPED